MGANSYQSYEEPDHAALVARDVVFCQRLALEKPDVAVTLGPDFLKKIGLTPRKREAPKLDTTIGVERYTNQAEALDRRIARLESGHRSLSLKSTDILDATAAEAGCTLGAILGRSRVPRIAQARFKAMWRIRNELGYSLGQIGKIFDARDHTTVLHGVNRWQSILDDAE